MATLRVVETLDVLEDRQSRFPSRFVVCVVDPLGLERVEEAFRHGVVEAVSRPAHAAADSVSIEQVLILGGAVLPLCGGGVFKGSGGPA